MDGRTKRTQRIVGRIKESALHLFLAHGVEQVSMDEIAAGAHVSKVTIYKYFHSKAELHRQVIDLYFDEILAATEELLDGPLDFLEKLNITLVSNLNAPRVADNDAFFAILESGGQAADGEPGRLPKRIRDIMYRFYEQGKKEGYIEEGLSFEQLYLYQQIFEAGFKAKSADLEAVMADPPALEQLLHLYFFGFIRKKE